MVLLAHPDPAPSRRVDQPVGIAPARPLRGFSGQRFRRAADGLPIEALVSEVAEIDRAAMHRRSPAAILMHPGSGVEWRWCDVLNSAVRRAADQHVAAAFA